MAEQNEAINFMEMKKTEKQTTEEVKPFTFIQNADCSVFTDLDFAIRTLSSIFNIQIPIQIQIQTQIYT